MADHQVRPQFLVLAARLVDPLAMGHGVLEGARAIVRLLGRPALELILNQTDPVTRARRIAADDGALPAQLPDQPPRDVAELRRGSFDGRRERACLGPFSPMPPTISTEH